MRVFFTKALRDTGYVNFDEPFTNLLTQGMVCKETYSCPNHGWLFPGEVITKGTEKTCEKCGSDVKVGRVEKMSKSKKNVVDPDELISSYGADTLRLFSLFAAPPEKEIEWSETGVEGCYRFINRVYRLIVAHLDLIKSDLPEIYEPKGGGSSDIVRYTNIAIKKVGADIERFQQNTAIAAIMEFVNNLYSVQDSLNDDVTKGAFKNAIKTLIILLTPFTPHLSEELNYLCGGEDFVSRAKWPLYKDEYTINEEITIVVQINGKVRAELTFNRNASEEEVLQKALSNEKVRTHIEGKNLVKKIYVPGKLVSLVVK